MTLSSMKQTWLEALGSWMRSNLHIRAIIETFLQPMKLQKAKHYIEHLAFRALSGTAILLPEALALSIGYFLGWIAGSVLRVRRPEVAAHLQTLLGCSVTPHQIVPRSARTSMIPPVSGKRRFGFAKSSLLLVKSSVWIYCSQISFLFVH